MVSTVEWFSQRCAKWKFTLQMGKTARDEKVFDQWLTQVEFDVRLQDAGIHIIEGEQLYQGEVVQRFEYRKSVLEVERWSMTFQSSTFQRFDVCTHRRSSSMIFFPLKPTFRRFIFASIRINVTSNSIPANCNERNDSWSTRRTAMWSTISEKSSISPWIIRRTRWNRWRKIIWPKARRWTITSPKKYRKRCRWKTIDRSKCEI